MTSNARRRAAARQPLTIAKAGSGSDTVNGSTHTMTGVTFGAEASDRYIYAVVAGSSASATLNSATIDGVAATIVIQKTQGVANIALIYALVPTGASGSIVANWSASLNRAGCEAYRVTGITNFAYDTAFVQTTAATAQSLAADVVAGGATIGGACTSGGGIAYTWAGGVTKDADRTIEAFLRISSASEATGATESGRAYTADGDDSGADKAMVLVTII